MKNNSKLMTLVATLVFTLTSTLAFAQPPQQGPKDNEGKGKNALFHCLRIVNLSEDQQAQIKGILETAQPTLQALREDIHAQKEALKAYLDAGEIEACEVGDAFLSIRASEQELRAERQKVLENIMLVLSPEQSAKLEGCLEAARDDFPGRGNGSGNGQGNGPGGN